MMKLLLILFFVGTFLFRNSPVSYKLKLVKEVEGFKSYVYRGYGDKPSIELLTNDSTFYLYIYSPLSMNLTVCAGFFFERHGDTLVKNDYRIYYSALQKFTKSYTSQLRSIEFVKASNFAWNFISNTEIEFRYLDVDTIIEENSPIVDSITKSLNGDGFIPLAIKADSNGNILLPCENGIVLKKESTGEGVNLFVQTFNIKLAFLNLRNTNLDIGDVIGRDAIIGTAKNNTICKAFK